MDRRGRGARSTAATPRVRSSIPARARARTVAKHPSGAAARIEYLVGKAVVGYREFDADGELLFDCGLRRGKRHGRAYRLDSPRKVLSVTPYRNGVEHGLARQWAHDGRLIGSYRMRHGTGVDLWWQETWTRPRRVYLAEVHFVRKGRPHGAEWWLNEDQTSVYEERHWLDGVLHGVEREWNARGVLRRGFPRFHVRGRRVTRSAYERACAADRALPAYRREDNRPDRVFPAAIARRLARSAATRPRVK